MAAPTHTIPTYLTDAEVVRELSLLGLSAHWDESEGIYLSADAARQIIVWCQTEWDRRQREGGA